MGDAVFHELLTVLNETEVLIPVLQVCLSVEFDRTITQPYGTVHQVGGMACTSIGRCGRNATDSVALWIGQEPQGGCYITVDVDPQMGGARLEVATVEFGIRAVLLDYEHINPETQEIMQLTWGQIGGRDDVYCHRYFLAIRAFRPATISVNAGSPIDHTWVSSSLSTASLPFPIVWVR